MDRELLGTLALGRLVASRGCRDAGAELGDAARQQGIAQVGLRARGQVQLCGGRLEGEEQEALIEGFVVGREVRPEARLLPGPLGAREGEAEPRAGDLLDQQQREVGLEAGVAGCDLAGALAPPGVEDRLESVVRAAGEREPQVPAQVGGQAWRRARRGAMRAASSLRAGSSMRLASKLEGCSPGSVSSVTPRSA